MTGFESALVKPASVSPAPGEPAFTESDIESSTESSVTLVVEPAVLPSIGQDERLALEPRYRVLIHNDDVTTFEYVNYILHAVFLLSAEIADHIAWTTHEDGFAVVVIRARSEAETLAKVANRLARSDGYPLTFTTEPDE